MLRKVYLEGEIGEKFGREFSMGAKNIRDVFRCIDCNVPGLKQYLIECEEKGVGFTCEVAGKAIEDEEHLLLPIKEGDVVITAIPAGSKSGGAKILAAIAIAVLSFYTFGAAGAAAGWGGASVSAGTGAMGLTTAASANIAMLGYTMAINLALTGIQQLMAPDPATDNQAGTENYLFNGSQQNIVEGDPVPVLYGELRIPGQPISFELLNRGFTSLSERVWGSNNIPIYPYLGSLGKIP